MDFKHLEIKTMALGLTVEKLTPHMGAIIHGIQLHESHHPMMIDYLKAMLSQHKVLFFRKQKENTESFQALAQLFGTIQVHPFNRSDTRNTPGVIRLYHHKGRKSDINTWHSDASWRPEAAYATFIRCLKCPSAGGDTMFANMAAAYEGLSDELKAQIANLEALHYITHFKNRMQREGTSQDQMDAYDKEFPPSAHPIVTTHPDTGEKILFVNDGYTIGIKDMPGEDGKALLQRLCRTVDTPEYQCRFKWEKGSVAIWDNRSTQHYPISDYWPEERWMERITTSGG